MRIRIKDMPAEERPRERLARLGPSALSNAELLSAVIGTGSSKESALDLSGRLLASHDLNRLSQISVGELKKTYGIDDAKACKIIASMELGKRAASAGGKKKQKISSADDIAKALMPSMRGLKKEIMKCVFLDSKCGIIGQETITMGGLNSNTAHPREIFAPAIAEAAAGIILVHNHPSGDPAPSREDIEMTKKIAEAGMILGIEVLDHIVIGNGKYASMKELGLV